jgi:hypothetical protein
VIITIYIYVNRIDRLLEGNVGKCAAGGRGQFVGDEEGGRYMGLLSVSSV